jgi:TolA-binding protein
MTDMGIRAWQEVVGVIGIFILLTCVITVTIWQVAASVRAKANIAREAAYQSLAERAVAAQESVDKQLGDARAQIADLQTRLSAMEKILSQVE